VCKLVRAVGIIRYVCGVSQLVVFCRSGDQSSVKVNSSIMNAVWRQLSRLVGEVIYTAHRISLTHESTHTKFKCTGWCATVALVFAGQFLNQNDGT
jgi:hypothetical protein